MPFVSIMCICASLAVRRAHLLVHTVAQIFSTTVFLYIDQELCMCTCRHHPPRDWIQLDEDNEVLEVKATEYPNQRRFPISSFEIKDAMAKKRSFTVVRVFGCSPKPDACFERKDVLVATRNPGCGIEVDGSVRLLFLQHPTELLERRVLKLSNSWEVVG